MSKYKLHEAVYARTLAAATYRVSIHNVATVVIIVFLYEVSFFVALSEAEGERVQHRYKKI